MFTKPIKYGLLASLSVVCLLLCTTPPTSTYRIVNDPPQAPWDQVDHERFVPYESGFTQHINDPNVQFGLRNNEGGPFSENIPIQFEGVHPRQDCDNMVGPINSQYYCRGPEFGYCDRRSGTCWCETGYAGKGCAQCAHAYYAEGELCLPRVYCPNDCSANGDCNYTTGECMCRDHRLGDDCSIPYCQQFDEKCIECESDRCIRCYDGYYNLNNKCHSCQTYDLRCFLCNEETCLTCLDPLLLSTTRSGVRLQDPELAQDEIDRAISVTLPFGSQREEAFLDAETYYLWYDVPDLRNASVSCEQGQHDDSRWVCERKFTSHRVCGNPGTISLSSPTYEIAEDAGQIPITLIRTGGGFDEIGISYDLLHISTDSSDFTDTMYYTSSQELRFPAGVIELTFYVPINDDVEVEGNEIFQIRLYNPVDGGTMGNTVTAFITILDDELPEQGTDRPSLAMCVTDQVRSGNIYEPLFFQVGRSTSLTVDMKDNASKSVSLEHDDGFDFIMLDMHLSEDTALQDKGMQWSQQYPPLQSTCERDPFGSESLYTCTITPERSGNYTLSLLLAKKWGLKAEFYDNAYFVGDPLISRIDRVVNYTWSYGPITRQNRDYVSARWHGKFRPLHTEMYTFSIDADDHVRLWIDGALLLDSWDSASSNTVRSRTIPLEWTRFHDVIVEWREIDNEAYVQVYYESYHNPRQVIRPERLFSTWALADYPIDVEVLPATTAAEKTIASGFGLDEVIAGEVGTFSILSRDANGNVLFALGISAAYQVVATHLTKSVFSAQYNSTLPINVTGYVLFNNRTNTHEVEFYPTISGQYNLSVYLVTGETDRDEIYGSPYLLTVHPTETYARYCDAYGEGLVYGIAGSVMQVDIVTRDIYRNLRLQGGDEFTIRIINTDARVAYSGECSDLDDSGNYSCSVTPNFYGEYAMAIMDANDQHVANSPYDIFIDYGPASGMSTAEGSGLSVAVAGVVANFTVQVRDVYSNKRLEGGDAVVLTLTSNSSNAIAGTCTHHNNGLYDCNYTAQAAGPQELSITVVGEDIVNSPFTVQVSDGAQQGTYTTAEGDGLSGSTAGEPIEFEVVVRDLYGNLRSSEDILLVTLMPTNASFNRLIDEPDPSTGQSLDVVFGTVEHIGVGHYLVTYNTTLRGTHQLDVTLTLEGGSGDSAEPISGSPWFPYTRAALTTAATTIVTGTGLEHGMAGVFAPIELQAQDIFGNYQETSGDKFYIDVEGFAHSPWFEEISIDGSFTDLGNEGKYSGGFTATKAGNYTVSVTQAQPGYLEAIYFDMPDLQYRSYPECEEIDADSDGILSVSERCKAGGTLPIATLEAEIDFRWPLNPIGDIKYDGWSARFTGLVQPAFTELYRLIVTTDDGVRLWVDGDLCIDEWNAGSSIHFCFVQLVSGRYHAFVLEYHDTIDDAWLKLEWESISQEKQVIPSTAMFHFEDVVDSPFNINIEPSTTHPESCIVYGDSLEEAIVNETREYFIESRDIFGNTRWNGGDTYTVFLSDPDDTREDEQTWLIALSSQLEDYSNGTYRMSYTSLVQGHFLLNVALSIAGFDLPQTVGSFSGAYNYTFENYETTITGESYEANRFLGQAEVMDTLAHRFVSNSPVEVTIDNSQASGPLSTVVSLPSYQWLDRELRFVEQSGLEGGVVGLPYSFQLHIRDTEGNTRRVVDDIVVRLSMVQPGPQELNSTSPVNVTTAVVYGTVESITSNSDTDDVLDGEYEATYTVELSGTYIMDVFLNDNDNDPLNILNGSPFTLNFSPNFTSPALTDVTGEGLTQAFVNQTNTLLVTSKDAFGNLQYYPNPTSVGQQTVPNFTMVCTPIHPGQDCVPVSIGADNFTVRVVGPDGMDEYDEFGDRLWHGRIESYGDGTHALRYTPPYHGEYILEVNLARPTPGLTGDYFETMWLDRDVIGTDAAVSRIDSEINFDWRAGDEEGPFIGAANLNASDYVGIRWSGLIAVEYDEYYTFEIDVPQQHQVRMKVDEEWIIQHWNETGIRLDGGDPDFVADGNLTGRYLMRSQILYDITVEYRIPFGSDAHITLYWESHSRTKEVVPRYWFWPGSYPLSNSPYRVTAA